MDEMRPAGAVECANCSHIRAIHEVGDPYTCRIGGCHCPGFETGIVADEPQGTPVFFTIPPGFGFSVNFYPLDLGLSVEKEPDD